MSINPTQLRTNLYNILDQIIETQKPIEIIRNGQVLEISVKNKINKSKLDTLTPHPGTISGDPESLIHNDWFSEWEGGDEL